MSLIPALVRLTVHRGSVWIAPRCARSAATVATPRRRLQRWKQTEYFEAPASARVRMPAAPVESVPGARSAVVAVVGAPNAGKSTLVNALVGEKVSAVSPKYNTTRDRVLGVYTSGNTQLQFVDTPGFVCEGGNGRHRFVKTLVTAATDSVPQADIVLYVLDIARRFDDEEHAALRRMVHLCAAAHAHVFLVANKADLLQQHGGAAGLRVTPGGGHAEQDTGTRVARRPVVSLDERVVAARSAFEAAAFEAGVIGPGGFDAERRPASALRGSGDAVVADGLARRSVYSFLPPVYVLAATHTHGHGVAALRTDLLRLAVPRAWDFSGDVTTDLAPLERVTEVIREQLFQHLHREVPYQVVQMNRSWKDLPDGGLVVHQDIQVPSSRVAQMLKARNGAPMRIITRTAIHQLERILRRRVHLFLHIAVKERASRGASAPAGALASA